MGSVILVELARATLSRVDPSSGNIEVVAECGGGPNGAAVGPDGHVYVANNGRLLHVARERGVTIPGPTPETYDGGWIERSTSGAVRRAHLHRVRWPGLVAPNDLVFDRPAACGSRSRVQRGEHSERPGLLYALADGSRIEGKAYGTDSTNGVACRRP